MTTQPPGEPARYQPQPIPEQARYLPPPPQNPPPLVQPQPPYAYGQAMPYHQVQPHSAALAVVASFFIPGLGSMLNDKVGKGIGILILSILAWVTAIFFIGFILGPAVWIWGMVAANNDARKWNRAHGIMS
jgi:TM2 domain-containing membrane protein YozV